MLCNSIEQRGEREKERERERLHSSYIQDLVGVEQLFECLLLLKIFIAS